MNIHRRFEILAALDGVLTRAPDGLRRYRLVAADEPGVELGEVRTSGGDSIFAIFTAQGWILRGFDHESPASPHCREPSEVLPGIYEQAPPELIALLRRYDRDSTEATFCLWQRQTDVEPQRGDVTYPEEDPDGGSSYLMGLLFDDADEYIEWSTAFYDVRLDEAMVRALYLGEASAEAVTEHAVLQRNVRRRYEVGHLTLSTAMPVFESRAIMLVRRVTGESLGTIRENLERGTDGVIYSLCLSSVLERSAGLRRVQSLVQGLRELGILVVAWHTLDEESARELDTPMRRVLSPDELNDLAGV